MIFFLLFLKTLLTKVSCRCYNCLPRHYSRREYMASISHGFQETDSSHSRCHSCSTGHSPVSSPVALKCSPAKVTNFVNKNEVLDLYIDGEKDVTRLNEKQNQKFPVRSTAPYLEWGWSPRPHSIVPSSPKVCKEIIENPSDINTDDIWHSELAYEGTKGASKVACMCHEGGHDARFLEASSECLLDFQKYRSQNMTTMDDLYEDLLDVRPSSPFFYSTPTDPIYSATSRYCVADVHCHEQSHGVRDFNLE